MAKPVLGDAQQTFAGGFDAGGAIAFIPPDQFAGMLNVRVLQSGDIAKRPGFKNACNVSSFGGNNVTSLVFWRSGSSSAEIIVVDDLGNLFVGGSFDPSTGTVVLGSLTAVGDASLGKSFAAFTDGSNDRLYLSSSSGKVYNTSSGRLGAGTPTGLQYLWVYNQRLFGVKTTDQTLYWSALNNGDTIGDTANGGGFDTIRTFGGGVIRGGFALGSMNVIVHDTALSVFTGRTFDDIQIQAGTEGLSADVGGISGHSFAAIDHVGYIVSNRGLFLVSPFGQVQSYRAATGLYDPIAAQIVANDYTTPVHIIDNARAQEIWFFLYGQTTPDDGRSQKIFIYSKTLRRFTGLAVPSSSVGIPLIPLAAGYYSNGIWPQMLIGDSGSHILACDFAKSSLEVFADGGSLAAYLSSVRCRRMFTEQPRHTKAFRRAAVEMGAGALGSASAGSVTGATLSYTTPTGGTVADTTDLNAGVTTLVQLSGQGQYADLTVTDGGSTTGWSLNSVEIEAFDYGLRGR